MLSFGSMAQVQNLGTPASWNMSSEQNTISFVQMPAVDVQEQMEIDAINKANGLDKVLRFGYEHVVNINLLEEGTSVFDKSENKITRYTLECPDAYSVNLVFNQFNLAEGTRLYIYNEDKTELIGAHTSENNNEENVLGTELIESSKIIIELDEPKSVIGQSSLTLGTVVHGYIPFRGVIDYLAKGIGDSGDCNVDVNCPDGQGWEFQRNSVALIILGGSVCSGSLVNSVGNTIGNVTPYFLTANHCGPGSVSSAVYRFRWESPESGVICATVGNSQNASTTKSVNGASLKANDGNADFILVELNSEPNQSWGVYYNGWDMTDALTVTSATGIHHPAGDIKKISHENQSPTHQVTNFNGTNNAEFWRIADWDVGVTEPGSSGSPLFDQNGRVIGVLSAGAAACSGTTDNNQFDIYGRFGVAWDDKTSSTQQLKFWLDPANTGATTLDGLATDLSVLENKKGEPSYAIYPNPTNGLFTISFENNKDSKEVSILNSLGQVMMNKLILGGQTELNVSTFPQGVYFVKVISNQVEETQRLVIQ